MRVLLLGSGGQLGRAVLATRPAAVHVDAPSSSDCDLSQPDTLVDVLRTGRHDLVINAAAYTAVDAAEGDAARARQLNTDAVHVLARECHALGTRLLHCSTDYVFDGRSGTPYRTDALTSPLGEYGRTKRDGERAVLALDTLGLVVRTAWLHSAHASNFVATAVHCLGAGRVMRVVDDQCGTPTRASHLAAALWAASARPALHGVLHFTDAGVASWYDVACSVKETLEELGELGNDAAVVPVPSSEVARSAPRPAFAVLDKHESWQQLGHAPVHWRTGVADSVRELRHA